MYGYGILTWYGYLRLGHSPFFSPLVTFLSCPTRAYPLSFHLVSGVLMFILGHTPSFFVLLCLASFSGFSRTSPDHSSILTKILPFSGTRLNSTLFRYSSGPFFSTRLDSTLLRYSPEPFSSTRPSSTLFRYSPGFYPSSVLT